AELSWQEPEHNAKLVDHYLLYIYELETGSEKADLSTELRIETVSKEARINQLEPGTRYLLQIIALGLGTSKEESELPRSLPTELRFKTSGVAPQARPFKDKIYAALERITQGHYVFSKFRPRELLAKLHIKVTKPEDYGLYKCKVSDDFGETEATV
uniref:Fibronectin type-III domain-containing protein n=1 Tax=Meloidogyne javanica TaxID=6303 RepID=A0A915MG56_MELJA